MPFEDQGVDGAEWRDDVWGLDDPEFLLVGEGMFEWNGSTWVSVNAHLGPDLKDASRRQIAGVSTDDVWATANNEVSHYNGDRWVPITTAGSSLSQTLEQEDLEIGTLHASDGGDMMLTASGDIYDLAKGPAGWDIVRRAETPCESLIDLAYGHNKSLYVIGQDRCLQRREGGTWDALDFPAPVFHPPARSLPNYDYRALIEHPDSPAPIVASWAGAHSIYPKGTSRDLQLLFKGSIVDGAYLEQKNAVLILQRKGVAAKYF